jgi:phenylpyruvate tautomerase PptA (4-oxalocrotonate tautomerase family)
LGSAGMVKVELRCLPAPSGSTVPRVALARIEILDGRTPGEKQELVDSISAALSQALRAPAADPSVRLLEYPPGQFSIPHPDRAL